MLTDCKLTIDGQVDPSSVATIVRDVLAGLPASAGDEDKVLALFRWVREHLFAFVSTMDDLLEPLNKAIQTINWWGFGLCGRQAKTLGILAAHLLGADNVRLVGMSEREHGAWRIGQDGRPYAFVWTPRTRGWKLGAQLGGHTSLEVRWGGQWHFLDVMVGFYRRDRQGRIASLQQIIDEPALADVPVGDPHGDMPYGPEVEIFTRSTAKFHKPGLNAWPGALPGLNLRPGERLTFLAEPLDGEVFIHPKMRAMFNDDVSAGGPREARPNAPAARYGNAEHVYDVELGPGDRLWCPETGDWHVPVSLPYPITSIHWEISPGGSGYLCYPPSTADEIMPIAASGSHRPGPDARMGLEYRVVVRAAELGQPARLRLRTIVQHNPLVRPRLLAGRNVVRLSAGGEGQLAARLQWQADGQRRAVELSGVGEHEVIVADESPARQTMSLLNICR